MKRSTVRSVVRISILATILLNIFLMPINVQIKPQSTVGAVGYSIEKL